MGSKTRIRARIRVAVIKSVLVELICTARTLAKRDKSADFVLAPYRWLVDQPVGVRDHADAAGAGELGAEFFEEGFDSVRGARRDHQVIRRDAGDFVAALFAAFALTGDVSHDRPALEAVLGEQFGDVSAVRGVDDDLDAFDGFHASPQMESIAAW